MTNVFSYSSFSLLRRVVVVFLVGTGMFAASVCAASARSTSPDDRDETGGLPRDRSDGGDRGSLNRRDRAFVEHAAEAGMFEAAAAHVALARAGDAQMRDFARHILRDH